MVDDSGKEHSRKSVEDIETLGGAEVEEATPVTEAAETSEVAGAAEEEPNDGGAAALPEDPIERLEAQLAEAIEGAASFKDQLYRKAAELENTKRRLNKQMDEVRRYGTMDVLRELLPVIDDLDRVIQHAEQRNKAGEAADEQTVVTAMLDGINMVAKKFITTLERFGLKGFDSIGETFDPQIHEAINQIETTEHPDGTVVEEFLKGYKLHDRLLRPAVVVVARNPSRSE